MGMVVFVGVYGGVAGCITKQVGQVKIRISSLKIHYIYIYRPGYKLMKAYIKL